MCKIAWFKDEIILTVDENIRERGALVVVFFQTSNELITALFKCWKSFEELVALWGM